MRDFYQLYCGCFEKRSFYLLYQMIERRFSNRAEYNARKVSINGIEYNSVTEASRALGVVPATIIYRIRSRSSRFSGYYYID